MKRFLQVQSTTVCCICLLLPLILLTTASYHFQCVYACSCAGEKSVSQAFSDARAFFLGNVTDILQTENEGKIRFEVQKAWKGIDEKVVTLATDEGNCSFGFTKGKQYLVYAYNQNIDHATGKEQEPVVLITNICLRTAAAEDARSDFASLGDGYVPVAGSASPEFTAYERGLLVGGVDRITLFTLIGVCVTIAVGFVVMKKTRHRVV